jgi:hypothetical protein
MLDQEKSLIPQIELLNSPESEFFAKLTDLQLLEGLQQINYKGPKKIASDSKTSPEALSFIAENEYGIDTKCAVARNPKTPKSALNHLICISSLYDSVDKDRLFLNLAQNESIAIEALNLINKLTNNTKVRKEISKKTNDINTLYTYAVEVADSLNNDHTYEGNTHPSFDSKVEFGDKLELALLLASNPNIPYEAKIILSECGYKIGYRQSISQDCSNLAGTLKFYLFINNLDDLSFLKELLNRNGGNSENNFGFKCVIARHKETPPEILQALSLEDEYVYPQYAIDNPNLPIQFLHDVIAKKNKNSKYAFNTFNYRISKNDLIS